ncbi:MAG: hypothetical protein FJ125_04250 [Deltaproteobacteria bacterium]|nr:hypothetical protein [Deltaproteobacteria bacterium]
MWGQLLAHWNEEKLHHAFIRFCKESGCLDYAARRYRRRLDAHPGEEQARKALEEICEQALTCLAPLDRKAVTRQRSGLVWAVSGILAALLALLLAYFIRRFGFLLPG